MWYDHITLFSFILCSAPALSGFLVYFRLWILRHQGCTWMLDAFPKEAGLWLMAASTGPKGFNSTITATMELPRLLEQGQMLGGLHGHSLIRFISRTDDGPSRIGQYQE